MLKMEAAQTYETWYLTTLHGATTQRNSTHFYFFAVQNLLRRWLSQAFLVSY